jgi:MoxR-like ATPase
VSERLDAAKATADRLVANIETVVHGKTERVKLVIAALACRGHVLFEDVPGTAKTVLARAIAGSIDGATTARVQCTPDLQPTDVTGLSVYNQQTRDFEFRPGPVFTNILLVDEINRAMPKTQSALLEAMAERQATVDGVTHPLPEPFLLIATENPIEQEGTFLLPEAQLDRFYVKTELGYPTVDQEMQIVREQRAEHPLARLCPVVSLAEILELEQAVGEVYVDELLLRWIVEIVQASRTAEPVALGASVRASLALERTSRAWALMHGRDFVTPEDVELLFLPVMSHRIVFKPRFVAETRHLGREGAFESFRDLVLSTVPPPEPSQERELRVLAGR